MKIIKIKISNVVIFAGKSLALSDKGLVSKDFVAPWCTTEKYTIEDVESIPYDWKGNHYSYTDDQWTKTPHGIQQDNIKNLEKEKVEDKETKMADLILRVERIEKLLESGGK